MSTYTYLPTTKPQGGDVDAPTVGGFALGFSMLGGLFWAFVKGQIIVGSVHREQLADKDAQIGRLWAAVDSLTASVQKYAVSAETSAHALHEVEKRAAKAGGE